MYQVSDLYKQAMKRPVQRHAMKGTIGDIPFTDRNILAGSFSITNQCSGNDNVEIGQVYIGELKATFLDVPLGRYLWKGQEIRPEFGMRLEDGTYEYIPLGVFTIDTAEWTACGVVVRAYDNMAKLDLLCNKVITEVTPFRCVQLIEKETGVKFGNDEEDFESFPNGKTIMSETTTNDIETWRDLVSWLAQTICCFATADRDGSIVFRAYTDEVTDTINSELRLTGASFSDFVTRYTGISVVNMADGTTSYYGLEKDDGLTMNLGSNPFLQFGIEETKEEMRRSILDALQKINYVPFKVKSIGNPAYDLGDVFIFSDGLADKTKKYCMTKFVFKYRGEYEICGVGQDPALASAKSKTDKNIIGLISNTDENTLVHYQFSNTKVVELGSGKRETIASIRFATATKDSEVTLWVELLLDTTMRTNHPIGDTQVQKVTVSSPPEVEELQSEIEAADTAIAALNTRLTTAETAIARPDRFTATISYMMNGTEIEYHPVETFAVDGPHTIDLNYYIGKVKANTIYNFVIMLQLDGGSGILNPNCVNAVLTGMGLAGTGQWDGTITAEEQLPGFLFDNILGRLVEETDVSTHVPMATGVMDSVIFSFAGLMGTLEESIGSRIVVRYYILSDTEGVPTMNHQYVAIDSEDAFVLNRAYSTISHLIPVDEGYLDELDITRDYDQLVLIESMEVT